MSGRRRSRGPTHIPERIVPASAPPNPYGLVEVYDAKARLREGSCPHPLHGQLQQRSPVDDAGYCPVCRWYIWYDPGSDTFGVAMPGNGAAVLPGDWFADPDLAQLQIARIQVEIEAMPNSKRPAVYGPASE